MSESPMRNAECPCCGDGSETRAITHTIFDCPKLEDVRNDFSQKLEITLPETWRSIIIRVKFRVMMASFKFVERGVFGPDYPPRRRPQASQERHSSYCIVNTF